MRKILLSLSMFFLFINIFACASNNNSYINYEQIEQNKAQGLPTWAYCQFTSKEESIYIDGYSNGTKGFYASGRGSSQEGARIDARKNLISYCTEQYGKENTDSDSIKIYGSRIIDSFEAENGNIYILMFISEKDAKKTFAN